MTEDDVNRPKEIPKGPSTVRKAEFKAIPVTMPGNAIGKMTTRLNASRPNHR